MESTGPGTAAYFPSILARIREAHPDLPLEPVIVQSVLLCLVAGDDDDPSSQIPSHGSRHLVLRTREEDAALVLNLAEVVLTTVFGFPTHKRRVKHHSEASLRSDEFHERAREQPEDFLRNLFFRRKHGSRWSMSTAREGSRKARSLHGPHRSSSYPSASLAVADNVPPPSSSHSREGTEESEIDVMSLGSSRRLFVTPASTLRVRPQAPRTVTEPPPVTAMSVAQRLAGSSPKLGTRRLESDFTMSLPKALAISGLEHAGMPAQRALLQVIHDRRLVLDAYESEDGIGRAWPLPEDFIIVYVCPIDSQGRPPVLRTLLDKFAMSVDVVVSPLTRQMYSYYRANLPTPPKHGANIYTFSPPTRHFTSHERDINCTTSFITGHITARDSISTLASSPSASCHTATAPNETGATA
ncbi:hypothetical protein NM688_g7010 [Phlebia brevispora]|uniref:Uncharacterized protein n=1 Tax=Phlebia brevispora TaxID=194682 RepID=A0ACC1SAF4_9APHY|nr:hypothetical protein NM688_g7010 [Phlebia brevispora]